MKSNTKLSSMREPAKYDVFISYSRRDYLDNENNPIADSPVTKLIDFLDKNNITYWIDKEGIYSGSEFVEILSTAIVSSKVLVFISSKASNESEWTTGEIFVARKYKIPIIPFKIDNTPYSKKLEIMLLPLDYVEYKVSPEESFTSLLKAIQIYLDEDEEQKKKEILKQIQAKEDEYIIHEKQIELIANEIISLHHSIGNDYKTCPVCGNQVSIEENFCTTCGWTFTPVYAPEPKAEGPHLSISKAVWNASNRPVTSSPTDNKTEHQPKTTTSFSSTKGTISGHEYVDLGLPSGTLWATCNVGASTPSDYGSYFAWGETSPKSIFEWGDVKYCYQKASLLKNFKFSKYVAESKYGTVDNKTRLEMEDDAARANWGGSWRMPTYDEWVELKNNCTWEWITQGGHKGYKVTNNKNSNSIFLPAVGYYYGSSSDFVGTNGHYWSSSLSTDDSYYAYECYFDLSHVDPSYWSYRYLGHSVRPVSSSFQN